MGIGLSVVSLLMFSVNVILTKIASSTVDVDFGFLISVSANVVVSLILLVFQCLLPGQHVDFQWQGVLIFMLAGVFSTYLGRFLYFDTIVKLGPAKASIFQVSNPLFTFLIAWFLLGEKLTVLCMIGIFLSLAGLFMISYVPRSLAKREVASPGSVMSLASGNGNKISAFQLHLVAKSGLFLGISSSVAYAIGNVLRGAAIHHWDEPIFGALLQALAGMALHFTTSDKVKQLRHEFREADRRGISLYVLGGALTIGGQTCVIAAMRYIPVSVATVISMCQPLLVIPISYFLLKNQEGITLRLIGGCLLVLAGIALISVF
ncbi:MAG: DMT family transporter [Alicyclobacillus macrosporangiidus]|uniref:DMT family transporter n=1 Tax=Alicyclobacillus macrosporangiidus TaxID=392015 RepID=UPI0026EC2AD8|nr:DMT family transporter [Alicyclobacillus macrosporangiidus]MCL6598127.1 DMT family transporter [Alicyclobacillus macrosporangiidus]